MRSDKKQRCVLCHKKVVSQYAPFCSERCAQLDLGRWLGGTYIIAGSAENSEQEDVSEEEHHNGGPL